MASLKIQVQDKGYNRFRAAVFDDGTNKLDVGIFSAGGSLTYPDGVTVLQVALWNEFGTKTQPARSFLRAWFEENEDLIRFWFEGEMLLHLRGSQTKLEALENVGKKCVKGIKARIRERIPPPNAKRTVELKGSNIPLIESGFMESVITYRVQGKKEPSTLRVALEHALEAVAEGVAEIL